jgi:hypothetical protein
MYVLARSLFLSSVFTLAACGAVDTGDAFDEAATSDNGLLHGAAEPHMFVDKGNAGKPTHGGSTPLLTYHNGNVLTHNNTYAIFWGSQWTNSNFAGDKISGISAFFTGYGGSNFAGTTTEYYDVENTAKVNITTASTFMGAQIDASTVPSRALTTTGAVAEGCKIAGNNPDPNDIYFIFTATGAGRVSYCAWHSWGTCSNGKPIQVAYMPNIDGIAGCDPGDTVTTHSQGLAALVNVTSHELSEAITDPRGTGWTDQSGQEDGDKCAWTFGGPVTFLSNNTTWVLQQEWSNSAYNAGTGTPRGCIQGN